MHAGGRSGKQHVLSRLQKSGGHLSQRELQDHARISSAALSEVLAKLECKGLVTRARSKEDRRQMEITLTELGEAKAIERRECLEAFEAQSLACLSEEERLQLLDMLDRLVEHWEKLEKEGGCA